MQTDKSLFYYGRIYHKLFDPALAEERQVAVDMVAERSSVVDMGCGTGQLCFALRDRKRCDVVGIDLSLRMLEFARTARPSRDITFVHADATDLPEYPDGSFDYGTVLMVVHELPMALRIRLLKELLRVAKKGIIIDSVTPLPVNARGMGIRVVERCFGYDHNPNFKAFLAEGGIGGILEKSALPVEIEHSAVFWRGCRQVVVVSRGH